MYKDPEIVNKLIDRNVSIKMFVPSSPHLLFIVVKCDREQESAPFNAQKAMIDAENLYKVKCTIKEL